MNTRDSDRGTLETSAWAALLICIGAVPLAVSKWPFLPSSLTFDSFAFPQNVVLALGVAIVLALCAATWATGRETLSVSRWMIPFAVFVGWAAVATFVAYDPLLSLFGTSISSLSLVNILAYAALSFLVLQLMRSKERLRALTWTVVGSAAVVASIALLQQLFDLNVFGLTGIAGWVTGRGFSTLGNPDHLGTFLVMPTVLSAFLVLFEEDSRWNGAAVASLAVLVAAVTGTLTRGAWIGVLFGAALAAALLYRAARTPAQNRRLGILLAVCVGAVVLAVSASDLADLGSRFGPRQPVTAEDTTADMVNSVSSDRISLWRSSASIVADRPLTGTGPAAFALGWYPNAVGYSSNGGEGALGDDPHSLPVHVATTTGLPGVLAYLVAVGAVLLLGLRHSVKLTKGKMPSGTGAYYVAWFVAAAALQVSLLVAAVTTPIVMYAFLGCAVLLRPSVRPVSTGAPSGAARFASAAVAAILALALGGAMVPQLSAELTLAGTLRGGSLDEAYDAARSVPWNLDIQKAYFHLRVADVNRGLAAGTPDAKVGVETVVGQLAQAGEARPHEFYFPSVRSQVLSEASNRYGDRTYAEAAVTAADEALAIMPASIPVRVQKATALSVLERYPEMADTLAGWWENEAGSAYPGILYAQALALSGKAAQAEEVFASLERRFPEEAASVRSAREQVAAPAKK